MGNGALARASCSDTSSPCGGGRTALAFTEGWAPGPVEHAAAASRELAATRRRVAVDTGLESPNPPGRDPDREHSCGRLRSRGIRTPVEKVPVGCKDILTARAANGAPAGGRGPGRRSRTPNSAAAAGSRLSGHVGFQKAQVDRRSRRLLRGQTRHNPQNRVFLLVSGPPPAWPGAIHPCWTIDVRPPRSPSNAFSRRASQVWGAYLAKPRGSGPTG